MNFRKAQQVRLVIADDHPIFRDGLRRLLEAESDFKVLGEASDGAEAVKLARQLKPDILLLDLAMPKHPGLEALRDLSMPANASPVRVILLTAAAAILGMIPIAPTVFWGPMAYAVMGGLVVATLLTLAFLPALYVTWFRISPADADIPLGSEASFMRAELKANSWHVPEFAA